MVLKSGYYYGTEIDEKWWKRYKKPNYFMRGNGEYWLDEKGIFFKRFMTQQPLVIPFEKIRDLKTGWFHAGKVGVGKIATKIIWENNDVLLSSGFNFGTNLETEEFVQQIKKITRKVEMYKNNEELVDLHIHTNASDGTWDIQETIAMIIEKNIKYFSITDHDTFENSLKALEYIPQNKRFVLGAEISSTYKGKEYHILAYGFDPENETLKKLLKDNQLIRRKYNDELINYVKEYEVVNDISDYDNYIWDLARGGWKSLNYLIDRGVVTGIESYFELIEISQLKLEFKSPAVVIEKIRQAGGYSILAHPSAYGEKNMKEDFLETWVAFGIDGLECYSPYFEDIKDASYYAKFCKENSLMISGGSDCHGKFNDRFIGVPKVTWEDTTLEKIFNNRL